MKLVHYDHDGRARFVTFATRGFLPVLSNARFRDIVEVCLTSVCAEHSTEILAYVIMPDHVHLVLVPPVGEKLGSLIGKIKEQSAKQIHDLLKPGSILETKLTAVRNRQRKFALWQKRCYDHNCRTEKEVWRLVRYCHFNPVRRGLVKDPGGWKWSSYGWYVS